MTDNILIQQITLNALTDDVSPFENLYYLLTDI